MTGVSSYPVASMPGAVTNPPRNQMCDAHPDVLATSRVQGETDSFGCEYVDMCDDCYSAYVQRDRTEEQTGACDYCKKHSHDLCLQRDLDEGLSGPIYKVCLDCRVDAAKRADDELGDTSMDYAWDGD